MHPKQNCEAVNSHKIRPTKSHKNNNKKKTTKKQKKKKKKKPTENLTLTTLLANSADG